MVILDTNIIIDHLRKSSENPLLPRIFEEYEDEPFGLSVISVQELYQGESTKNESNETELINVLAQMEILPYEIETAKMAGELVRDKICNDFTDAAIAATAILNKSKLLTLNKKHFKGIKNLELFNLNFQF